CNIVTLAECKIGCAAPSWLLSLFSSAVTDLAVSATFWTLAPGNLGVFCAFSDVVRWVVEPYDFRAGRRGRCGSGVCRGWKAARGGLPCDRPGAQPGGRQSPARRQQDRRRLPRRAAGRGRNLDAAGS